MELYLPMDFQKRVSGKKDYEKNQRVEKISVS